MSSVQRFDAALALDVIAGLLTSGQSITAALRLLGENLPGCQILREVAARLGYGLDWAGAWNIIDDADHRDDPHSARDLAQLRDELGFVALAAVPSADVLHSAASALRRNRKRRAEQLAAELGIRLVLPMGVCLLPSFICLGVIPLVIALLP